ncbi:MAG: hypothetical protein HYY13_03325 [Nitrospirae bacterium]|nr:hypothetical protein [Nitrospirota bacterium]
MGPRLLLSATLATATTLLAASASGATEIRVAAGTIRTTDSAQKDFVPSHKSGEILLHLDARIRNGYNGPQPGLWIRPFSILDLDVRLSTAWWPLYRIFKNEYSLDTVLLGYGTPPVATTPARRPADPYAGAGVFGGSDFYRPRLSSSALSWNDTHDPRLPRVQIFTWRTAGLKGFAGRPIGGYRLDGALGAYHLLSLNSSALLHDIDTEEAENALSRVFMSETHTKQNYYYSQGLLIEARGALARENLGEFGFTDKFFAFQPLLHNGEIRDQMNLLRSYLRAYLSPRIDLELGAEHWTIRGRIDERRETAHWASIWACLAYRL